MGEISEEEIVKELKKKDLSEFGNVSNENPLENALWCLMVVKDKTIVKNLTAKAISFILSELKEIDINEKSIIRAFSRAHKKVKARKINSKIYYEIMKSGREYIQKVSNNTSTLFFVSGKKAWTDSNKNLPEFIKKLKGELLIVDPFYGIGTLHNLEKFEKSNKIRFITSQMGRDENEEKFKRELTKFRSEFKHVEIRKYDKFYELHDRYVISENGLVIIGHGLKDFGTKESFMVALFNEEIISFLPTLKRAFEEKWKKAVILKK